MDNIMQNTAEVPACNSHFQKIQTFLTCLCHLTCNLKYIVSQTSVLDRQIYRQQETTITL